MTPDISSQIEAAVGLDIFGDIHDHLAPWSALSNISTVRRLEAA